jgi:hypothetical protein
MEVGTIFESRDATFFKTNFPMKNIPHEHIILIGQSEELSVF